jgi:hypothetical protein
MLPRKRINTGENNIIPMKGRALLCIVLGLLAVTPALAPAAERAGESPMGTPEGWSDDINISNDALTDKYPAIAINDDDIRLVWVHDYFNLVYANSSDGGRSWSPFITLTQTTGGIFSPDIAVSGQNVHVVWDDYRGSDSTTYYRNSSDGGVNWNPEKKIPSSATYAGGSKIYVNNSNIHIIWLDQRDGSNGEVYYRRSLDGGITFDNGQGVDEDRRLTFSTADVTSIHLAGSGSNISVTWLDERNGIWEIYWMISKDNGFTWEDGLGNVGQDRRLTTTGAEGHAIAVNGPNIHIVYVDPVNLTTYNLYYINSTDNGFTWCAPIFLSGPTPLINSPDIDVYGNNINIVWDDRRDDGTTTEIYYKNSTDGGITWSSDIRLTNSTGYDSLWPRIAVINTTKHVTWFDRRDGNREIYYKRSPDFPAPSYTIPLNQGWNLLSTPLIPEDEAINKVLENITGKWDYIQLYNSTDSDHWKTNLTYRPDQLNDLNSLDYSMGFWINITEPGVSLTLKGQIPDNTVIPLKAGWNLVGYPTLNDTMTVGNALWGTGADRVEVCDALAPYRLREVGSTYIMKPGEGYWVHVPADTTWVVDW